MSSLAMWLVPGAEVYVVAFAVLWGCLGGWLAIAPTATASYFGTCAYPRCYGLVFLAFGAGAIACPQLARFIRTTTGNYLGVFPLVFILAILGLGIATILLKPPERKKSEMNKIWKLWFWCGVYGIPEPVNFTPAKS